VEDIMTSWDLRDEIAEIIDKAGDEEASKVADRIMELLQRSDAGPNAVPEGADR
jgi:hypothetical protein